MFKEKNLFVSGLVDVHFYIEDTKYFMACQDSYDKDCKKEISKEFYEAAKKEFANFNYYKEAKKAISKTSFGPFYHNIVTMILRDLADKTSVDMANQLIDELQLDFEKVQ